MISSLREFTDDEYDLLFGAGVWDQLSRGPQSHAAIALWAMGLAVRRPADIARLRLDGVFFGETVPIDAASLRAQFTQTVIERLEAGSLEEAAERALTTPVLVGEDPEIMLDRWRALPAGLRARARASWIRRTEAHLDYAAGRLTRLGRAWCVQDAQPISLEPLELLAQDLVEVGRWKAPSEETARTRTEALLGRTEYLRERLAQLVDKPLGLGSRAEERALVLEVVRWSARMRMLG